MSRRSKTQAFVARRRNWRNLIASAKVEELPGGDVLYRFPAGTMFRMGLVALTPVKLVICSDPLRLHDVVDRFAPLEPQRV